MKDRVKILVSLGIEFSEVLENENSNNFPSFDFIYASNPWFIPEFVK